VHADERLTAFLELQAAIVVNSNSDEILGNNRRQISAKPDGVGAAFRPLIVRRGQSGLQTRIAATEIVS